MRAQTPTGEELIGLYSVETSDLTSVTMPIIGSILYNPTVKNLYVYTVDGWREVGNQSVTLTGSGSTTISGTYPNFTISSTDNVDDADADATNELSNLQLAESILTLSKPATAGNSVDLSKMVNRYISINEFVRSEPVLQDKGRIMFTVPADLAGYQTNKMTCSIRELGGGAGTVQISALYWRAGTEAPINETVSFNSSTTYTGSSSGASAITLQQGDLVYLNIDSAPTFSNAPKGLSCTIKLVKP
ncbi:MAG: hypothetical protein ACK5NB_00285 [Flavobacteriaceae bacterium]